MTTISRFIGFLLVILFFFLTSCSSDDNSPALEPVKAMTSANLTTYLEELAQDPNLPGFAISIVKDGKLKYQEAFGYADVENKVPYTNETVNSIASVSKTFVGVAVVKAIEQGYFTLETDISTLLPVTIINPKQPNIPIRIRDLVTHTSGLLDAPEVYLANNYYILEGENTSTPGASLLMNEIGIEQREAFDLDEFLAEYFLEDGAMYSLNNFANTAPGTTWSYSNLATGLMGFIIESVTQESFDEYVRTQILEPLQMNASSYAISDIDTELMAVRYLDTQTPFPFYSNDSYPEGGLYSTNRDMGKYLLDMANGIKGQSTQLFSTEMYNLLFAPQLQAGIVPADFAENHGLFWYRKDGKVMHGGNSFGISTHLEIAENGNSGYLFLSNMDASFSGNYEKYNSVISRVEKAVDQFIEAN
ncbi:serine hydrolase [Zobellia roscoffensis]|uniref:serine hydrolase domain-containing protein n=1 Tax=Zobellia roscoffensis TaxID=2779508 RepID=UPI00188A3184|nr:serine hydrolase domain-containing protein [Zobellia roscoffensis]